MRVLRAHIAVSACQVDHAVFVHRRGRDAVNQGDHVRDRRGRAVDFRARIIIGQGHTNRVRVAGRARGVVVQVLVRQRECLAARRAGSERILLDVAGGERIAPVNRQRERVQCPGIDDVASQRCRFALVDRRSDRHVYQFSRHVVDRHHRVSAASAKIIVANRHGDVVVVAGRPRWIVVQVLVRFAERRGTGCVAEGLRGRTVSPLHRNRKRVQRPRIGDYPGQRGHVVLVNRRYRIQRKRRSDVVDRHRKRIARAVAVVVGYGNRGGEDTIVLVDVATGNRSGPTTFGDRCLGDRSVAPVNRRGVQIIRRRIGEGRGGVDRVSLVRGLVTARDDGRGHVVHGQYAQCDGVPTVVVGHRQRNDELVHRLVDHIAVEILMGELKVLRPSRAGRQRVSHGSAIIAPVDH